MMQYMKESGLQINWLTNAVNPNILIILMTKEEKNMLQSLHVTFITLIGNLLR